MTNNQLTTGAHMTSTRLLTALRALSVPTPELVQEGYTA
jgi:hypothetical protein